MTSFFGGLPTGFYEGFFNDPFLTSDMDFDMLPLEAQNQFLLQQQPQQQGDRSQQQMASRGQRRRAAREQALQRGMRVNLVQEEEKYCVCFEVPGRTKDDLCVALEANILKVCGKALEPEEEEEAEHRPAPPSEQVKVAGQPEQPSQQPSTGQPQPPAPESKAAELSGGEKMREQQQPTQEQPPTKPKRRYLIREIPSPLSPHTLTAASPTYGFSSRLSHRAFRVASCVSSWPYRALHSSPRGRRRGPLTQLRGYTAARCCPEALTSQSAVAVLLTFRRASSDESPAPVGARTHLKLLSPAARALFPSVTQCAKCQNGVLTVCVPRLPKKRPVPIQ